MARPSAKRHGEAMSGALAVAAGPGEWESVQPGAHAPQHPSLEESDLTIATSEAECCQAECCIVGAGPAGVTLAWLLASQGVDVVLLERRQDFERDFRGDTLHPGVLELLDQMGLAQRILALPHSRMATLSFHTPDSSLVVADLSRLKTRFPFVAMLPQARFLETLVRDAARFPTFRIVMGADAQRLVQEDGVVRGVSYRDGQQNWRTVRADLTCAADGRSSRIRKLAGSDAVRSAPEIDVLWFRLDRRPGQFGGAFLAPHGYMIVLERESQWQAGYVIQKGQYRLLVEAGIGAFRQAIMDLAPPLADSAASLADWASIRLLSVQADCLRRWCQPGLLFLGDAAHVMSPVGGVGINYAIQDAVEAANLLAAPLRSRRVRLADLRRVQRRRKGPTRLVQWLQALDQRHLIERSLKSSGPARLPWWFRGLFKTPLLRTLPSRLFAFGVRRVAIRLPLNH